MARYIFKSCKDVNYDKIAADRSDCFRMEYFAESLSSDLFFCVKELSIIQSNLNLWNYCIDGQLSIFWLFIVIVSNLNYFQYAEPHFLNPLKHDVSKHLNLTVAIG